MADRTVTEGCDGGSTSLPAATLRVSQAGPVHATTSTRLGPGCPSYIIRCAGNHGLGVQTVYEGCACGHGSWGMQAD